MRRLMLELSIRLGVSIREIEAWDMKTIREYVAVLTAQGRGGAGSSALAQSPEKLEADLMKMFGGPR